MKQFKTIEKVKNIFPTINGLHLALLYGSFGRKEANPNSDIDIQILVDENFQSKNLISALIKGFEDEIQHITEVSLRNKIVVYFKSHPKVEFGICKNLNDINRNYLGSEITDISSTILYICNNSDIRIEEYLNLIINEHNRNKSELKQEKQIVELINKFVYEFENCSNLHRRSDGFQFYFFYNIAMHVAIQLYQLSTGETKYNFLPKNFLSRTLKKEEERTFRELRGTLFLPDANKQKRKLLDFFYRSITNLVSMQQQEELKQFLEWIYNRDFLWNFRDISANNPQIKSGIIYRTATLTFIQDESFFEAFLKEKRIYTVIDLRAEGEILELPYNEIALSNFHYVKTPFDPLNQSAEFKTTHQYGTNNEIAYRFFGIECKQSIKNALEAIINAQNAIAIHCHAGKDRTGILISLLHLLVDSGLHIVYTDYLATEMDTKKEYLNIFLNIIHEKGGIVPYLIDCGLDQTQISHLKNKLINGN